MVSSDRVKMLVKTTIGLGLATRNCSPMAPITSQGGAPSSGFPPPCSTPDRVLSRDTLAPLAMPRARAITPRPLPMKARSPVAKASFQVDGLRLIGPEILGRIKRHSLHRHLQSSSSAAVVLDQWLSQDQIPLSESGQCRLSNGLKDIYLGFCLLHRLGRKWTMPN